MPKTKRLLHCPDDVDAVYELLKEKMRANGPGTVRETEQALGLYRGYIRYHRHRRELDVGALMAILKHLRIPPADFFAEVGAMLGTEAQEPKPEPEPEPDDPPLGAPPDIEPLTARAVLRKAGADLPIYGDVDP